MISGSFEYRLDPFFHISPPAGQLNDAAFRHVRMLDKLHPDTPVLPAIVRGHFVSWYSLLTLPLGEVTNS